MDIPLEIACLLSAGEPLPHLHTSHTTVLTDSPKVPIKVNGKMIFVPKILFDILSDLSGFAICYDKA